LKAEHCPDFRCAERERQSSDCSQAQQYVAADELIAKMRQKGVRFDEGTYTVAIQLYRRWAKPEALKLIWEEVRPGPVPSDVTFAHILRCAPLRARLQQQQQRYKWLFQTLGYLSRRCDYYYSSQDPFLPDSEDRKPPQRLSCSRA
jgi:hypothetical protein